MATELPELSSWSVTAGGQDRVEAAHATRPVTAMALGDHLWLPFGTDDERAEVVASFVRDGQVLGDRVLYVAGVAGAEPVYECLARREVDVTPLLVTGQLSVVTFDAPSLSDLRAHARTARASGYRTLRVTVDMSDLPPAPSPRFDEFESGLQAVCESEAAMVLCQYDQRTLSAVGRHTCVRAHRGAASAGNSALRITRTQYPAGLRLEGDVDVISYADMGKALAAAAPTTRDDLHLDLRGLGFIDLAGIATLLAATLQALADDRRLVLDHLPPQIADVLGLMGWDGTPGLTLGFR